MNIELLREFGLPTFFALGSAAFLFQMYRWHRDERKEWRNDTNKRHDEYLKRQERREDRVDDTLNKTADALRELTTAIERQNNRHRRADDA